jgi:outer membrane lipoprotein-sorting protein
VSRLRRISTRRLIVLCVALLAVAVGGTALAIAATSGGDVPSQKPLAKAVHDALAAPEQQGIEARIKFTNHLVDNVDFRGWNPLIGGGDGRLWATSDGKFRLELQSSGGDAQIVSNGKRWWAYDGESDTLYHGRVPRHREHHWRTPSVGRIQRVINRVMRHATIEGPTPTNVAGRPAYSTRASLKQHSGLLGAVEFAWDSATGTPLRGAVYAKGENDPVLALEATEISFGAIPDSTFDVPEPTGVQAQNVRGHREGGRRHRGKPVTGLARVQRKLGFDVSAPAQLEGRKRQFVALVGHDRAHRSALVAYGRSLDGIAVIERRVSGAPETGDGPLDGADLPSVDVNGVTGERLSTPLGTVVRFERDGISYTVIASAVPSVVEAAARGL